jgi:biopolymer transport protein TolR
MARTFRRQRQSHPIAELNITNLVDLGFTLLIIFMIATPLINQEQSMKVNLPLESKSQQAKPDPNAKFETVVINPDGTYSLGNKPMTLPQLTVELARFGAQPKPPVIVIRADANSTMQHFISLKEVLQKEGLSKIEISTQTSK